MNRIESRIKAMPTGKINVESSLQGVVGVEKAGELTHRQGLTAMQQSDRPERPERPVSMTK